MCNRKYNKNIYFIVFFIWSFLESGLGLKKSINQDLVFTSKVRCQLDNNTVTSTK